MKISHSIKETGLADRWDKLDWNVIDERVGSMQTELSKASMDGNQELLSRLTEEFLDSFEARAVAVRNVTRNEATDNPGVGEVWSTSADKMKAVMILNHHGYSSEPFYSFVMFEPKTKKDRTMCIPTFYDRAMHDLFRMLMEPICEPLYDKRLFSSRTKRSLTDAAVEVEYLFSDEHSPEWVVRCDVKSFYDTMSHEWLLDHVPMDRHILKEFLKAPRVENGTGKPTVPECGVPTGNRMSPILANMMLNGLEDELRDLNDPDNGIVVRWVDDIVVTARTEDEALHCMARVKRFVSDRGMRLNDDKSYVANVRDGFEFLKYRYVKEGDRIHMTPLEKSVDDFIDEMKEAVMKHDDELSVVKTANSHVRGFTNKYRVSDMSGCAERMDKAVIEIVSERVSSLLRVTHESMLKSRIMSDGKGWFFQTPDGLRLRRITDIVPVDHERIWLSANPFIHRDYFEERSERERISKVANDGLREIWESSCGCCMLCGMRIRRSEPRVLATDDDGVRWYSHAVCKENQERNLGRLSFVTPLRRRAESDVSVELTVDIPEQPQETVSVEEVESEEKENVPESEGESSPDGIIDQDGNYPETEDIQVKNQSDEGTRHPEQMKIVPTEKKIVIVPTKKGVSKFQILVNYLNNIPYSYFDFTFDGINNFLTGGLCESAYKDRSWWLRKGRASIGQALESTEWAVEDVNMEKQTVRFSKAAKVKYTPPEIAFRNRNYGPKTEQFIAERDERMRKSPFGNVTRFLMSCGLDQIRLQFDKIVELTGLPLPEWSKDKRWWSNRKPKSILLAVEDAEYTKVELDMEGRSMLLTRTCCMPDRKRDAVVLGDLPIKPHMRPKKTN